MPDEPLITTELFWDCECGEKFIHFRTSPVCDDCLCKMEDQPSSRISEVLAGGLSLCACAKDARTDGVRADLARELASRVWHGAVSDRMLEERIQENETPFGIQLDDLGDEP